ncbi:hypothetical protein [Nocardia farcinica]|uniref:hypothetical protein n=1 Tax=Nocardia farcinica TaxID=37329 RepID=UPI003CC7F227
MTATAAATGRQPGTPVFTHHTRGRWLEHWEPDNPEFWEAGGKRTARKNLAFSVFAENLGFSVWVIWGTVVTSMGAAGFPFLAGLGQGNPVAGGGAEVRAQDPPLRGGGQGRAEYAVRERGQRRGDLLRGQPALTLMQVDLRGERGQQHVDE